MTEYSTDRVHSEVDPASSPRRSKSVLRSFRFAWEGLSRPLQNGFDIDFGHPLADLPVNNVADAVSFTHLTATTTFHL